MSEPLEERLSRFTPDATTLNRDALLFAAGRASVRPSRLWQVLAGSLALSQLLTFVCLWPRTPSQPTVEPFIATQPHRPDPTSVATSGPDPSELRSLRQRMQDTDFDYLTPPSEESLAPEEPPLRGFGAPPAYLLN